jgi:hypothetical protein
MPAGPGAIPDDAGAIPDDAGAIPDDAGAIPDGPGPIPDGRVASCPIFRARRNPTKHASAASPKIPT